MQGATAPGNEPIGLILPPLSAPVFVQDPQLPHLNILIAIAGAYFGQDEALAALWEEPRELE